MELSTKKCKKCGLIKLLSEFYRNPGLKSGIANECKECSKKMHYRWRDSNLEKAKESVNKTLKKLRQQFIDAYGGKCSCCGESAPEFLTVEHKFGGGKHDRKSQGGALGLLRSMRDQGWPKDEYDLLCYNCNCGKRLGRICPHKSMDNNRSGILTYKYEKANLTNEFSEVCTGDMPSMDRVLYYLMNPEESDFPECARKQRDWWRSQKVEH